MTKRPSTDQEQTEATGQASTSMLDRLEKLASAASASAQATQWRARKNGLQDQGEPSEVRNLNDDAEAKAHAEEAMRQMMAKTQGKRC
jgi:hypothetical protein